MSARITLFLALCAIHLLPFYWELSDALAPLWAGSVYLPLMGLKALGLRVFSNVISGGWQSPSLTGWTIVVLFWAIIWWNLAGVALMLARSRKRTVKEK